MSGGRRALRAAADGLDERGVEGAWQRAGRLIGWWYTRCERPGRGERVWREGERPVGLALLIGSSRPLLIEPISIVMVVRTSEMGRRAAHHGHVRDGRLVLAHFARPSLDQQAFPVS